MVESQSPLSEVWFFLLESFISDQNILDKNSNQEDKTSAVINTFSSPLKEAREHFEKEYPHSNSFGVHIQKYGLYLHIIVLKMP